MASTPPTAEPLPSSISEAYATYHDGTEMPSSFHPYPSTGYAQFGIRGAVKAYSIHLSIDYLGTSTIGIYSIDGIYSTDS
ncbi:hypothetical protein COCNU_scaffold011230G000010 [Cocos nucifera]|nr:hypothetical protein [Cocos nucifera]